MVLRAEPRKVGRNRRTKRTSKASADAIRNFGSTHPDAKASPALAQLREELEDDEEIRKREWLAQEAKRKEEARLQRLREAEIASTAVVERCVKPLCVVCSFSWSNIAHPLRPVQTWT